MVLGIAQLDGLMVRGDGRAGDDWDKLGLPDHDGEGTLDRWQLNFERK